MRKEFSFHRGIYVFNTVRSPAFATFFCLFRQQNLFRRLSRSSFRVDSVSVSPSSLANRFRSGSVETFSIDVGLLNFARGRDIHIFLSLFVPTD